MIQLLRNKQLILVKIDYFMPDYKHIINEFIWQTEDLVPDIPNVHKFLRYWQHNVEATINRVFIQHSHQSNWKAVDIVKDYN